MPAFFDLKCCCCGTKEKRPADQCHEMQYCNQCGCPMTLEKVTLNRKAK